MSGIDLANPSMLRSLASAASGLMNKQKDPYLRVNYENLANACARTAARIEKVEMMRRRSLEWAAGREAVAKQQKDSVLEPAPEPEPEPTGPEEPTGDAEDTDEPDLFS